VSVEFCGLQLAHPVINGSGTFDAIAARRAFGDALTEDFPFAAYVSKTITLEPRDGNPAPRLWEAAAGLVNSIGLPNKGLEGYLREDLPQLLAITSRANAGDGPGVPLITNVMGASSDELMRLVEACDRRAEIAAIELNVSCPNVATGLDIGADPGQLEQVVAAVRGATDKPLIVKLTPNTADVALCARAAEAAGADAVSLINTLRAMALGPAVALAQVAAVAARVSIPVIGMGGVQSAADARELIGVGATLVAVGTESFRDPAAAARVARGLLADQTG
jgi:dihydroorotate dehydrogenase (NAD+) catalytic subunit